MTGSLLDELPGVGPVRKRALLDHFGSPDRLVTASREELEAVPGIPGKLAREIHRQLHKAGDDGVEATRSRPRGPTARAPSTWS